MKVTSDIIKDDMELLKNRRVEADPTKAWNSNSLISYRDELCYLTDAESWQEICDGFREDNDEFIDTPTHVEIYFLEKLEEVLQDNYNSDKGFIEMIEWIENNIPE